MLQEIWSYELYNNGDHVIRVANLGYALALLILARILFWYFAKVLLKRYFRRNDVAEGRSFSITQLFRYIFYTVIALLCMQTLGIQITVLYAAMAALLVGVGIGLQQTFNDVTSGVILLIEGSIKVGDWLDISGTEGIVRHIGLRTSQIETRRGIAIIVPNSKITVENVTNLRGFNQIIRHQIDVGVAYKSDIDLVQKVLLSCLEGAEHIVMEPQPRVRLTAFGNSSLDVQLLFWSSELQTIEEVKSVLRIRIAKAFRENDIEIPFPQTDLNLKNLPPHLEGVTLEEE